MRTVVAVTAVIVLGCTACAAPSGGAPTPPYRVNLGVSNATTLVVTLFVNGGRVAEFPPGGQIRTFVRPGGAVKQVGTVGRVDLSCGRLTIWAGFEPSGGPIPLASPGTPGDCEP